MRQRLSFCSLGLTDLHVVPAALITSLRCVLHVTTAGYSRTEKSVYLPYLVASCPHVTSESVETVANVKRMRRNFGTASTTAVPLT